MSRRTFRSKVEVLRYLSIESANPTVAVNTKLSVSFSFLDAVFIVCFFTCST